MEYANIQLDSASIVSYGDRFQPQPGPMLGLGLGPGVQGWVQLHTEKKREREKLAATASIKMPH